MATLDVNKFLEKLETKYGKKFKLLDEYKGVHKNSKFLCIDCGHEFEIAPNNLMKTGRCTVCSKELTKKNLRPLYDFKELDQFVKEYRKKRKDGAEYELISEYKGSQNRIVLRHKCGYEFDVRATNFLNDNAKCPLCFKAYQTPELFELKFFKKFSRNDYEILLPFKKSSEKVILKHKCGEIIKILPSNVLAEHCKEPCQKCYKRQKHEEFQKKFYKEFEEISDLFELVSMNNVHERKNGKITVKHKKCGKQFQTTIYQLLKNKHCKYCSSSINESKIIYYLTKRNIPFEYKYRGFKDCKNILPLEFDFAIFNKDSSLYSLIEFDGEQHQKPFRFSNNYENCIKKFNEIQLRDSIKNEYCKANNLNLYRIPYTEEKNLEKHLEKILENYNFNDYPLDVEIHQQE